MIALFALACGSSNAEQPYLDGSGPAPSRPDGGGLLDTLPPPPPDAGPSDTGVSVVPDLGLATPDLAGDSTPPQSPDAAPACLMPRACDAPPPPDPAKRAWKNFGSGVAAVSPARHRGRDLFFVAGAPQWLIGKFTYGPFDIDIAGEEVDVFLLRDCATWEMLGTALTTSDGQHPETEGADDSGGRVYFPIPESRRLGPGRHRVRFVVAGDGTSTELFVEVVPAATRLAVIDVDGTLTSSEAAEFGALLGGQLPEAQPDAAKVIELLARKGYRPLFLTARPEWLVPRTREFLSAASFPAGIVETTTGGSGALGADATKFKTAALARLKAKGLEPALAIGNTDTDAAAYAAAGIPQESRLFLKYTDAQHGGRRFDRYAELLGDLERLPEVCR